jgi:L-iditol 2-dehydrogenase
MRVLRLHAAGDLRLHEEERPQPTAGEALLRVAAVGICGSDLHWFSESGIGDARLAQPLVLGHEFAARRASDGRLVAVDPAIPCGKCSACLEGNPNLCPQIIFAGHGEQDGALRDEMAWPERNCFPLPEGLNPVDGAMLEPLGVAIFALDLAKLRIGASVGVFGCGPIGLLILQLARQAGAARILATDRLAHRVDAARRFGADLALQTGTDGRAPDLEGQLNGGTLDLVFEVAGDNPAVEEAIQAVKPGGRVILVGIPPDDRTSFTASVARRKGLSILLCRRMKHTYPRAIHLVQSGKVDVRSLATHIFPLAEAEKAFRVAGRREGHKVIILP